MRSLISHITAVFTLLLFAFATSATQAGSLNGIVYGGSLPLAGAEVSLYLVMASDGTADGGTGSGDGTAEPVNPGPVATVTTDINGHYLLDGLEAGLYNLVVAPPIESGFGNTVISDVEVGAGDSQRNVVLVESASVLSGTVSDGDGQPISGIKLVVNELSSGTEVGQIVTDELGQYQLPVAPGTYEIDASYDWNSTPNRPSPDVFRVWPVVSEVSVSGETTQDVQLPFVTLSGQTTDQNGVPVAGVQIKAEDGWSTTDALGRYQYRQVDTSTISDGNGRYTLVVVAGLDTLTFIPQTGSELSQKVVTNLNLLESIERDFALPPEQILKGTVFDGDGQPISGIKLVVNELSSGTEVGQIVTDELGQYQLPVAPGTYEIDASYDWNSTPNRPSPDVFRVWPVVSEVSVSGETTQDVQLPFVTLSGQTTDQNGVPVAGVQIKAEDGWSTTDALGRYQYRQVDTSTISDGNGRYTLVVVAGLDTLTFIPQTGSELSQKVVTNLNLLESIERDFALPPEQILKGTVFDGDGQPISGIKLVVNELSSGTEVGQIVTDELGQYQLPVAPGTYEIDASYDWNSTPNRPSPDVFRVWPVVSEVSVSGETTQDVQLPFVTLSGQTTDQNGVPVAGVQIKAEDGWSTTDALGRYQYRQVDTSTISDGNGRYTLVVVAGLDSQTIMPPDNSGFAQTVISEMNLQSNLEQSIILPFNDVTAPVITSAPRATDITDTGAVIQWQTDEPSSSVVTVNGIVVEVPGYRMSHSVAVSGLSASQQYSAAVSSTDKDGNGPVFASASFTTKATPDTDAPVILEGPVVTSVSHDRAVVEWRTNEPATTQATYGVADAAAQILVSEGLRENHRIEFTGLTAASIYLVNVESVDAAGNGPVVASADFRTLPVPDVNAPVFVSGPVLTSIGPDSVIVEWQTDEPSVSAISLNDGTEYTVIRDENFTTSHSVTVTGLTPAMDYTYTVSATDSLGNGPVLSEPDSFRTQELADSQPPIITEALKVVGITHQSAVVHWRTDEPADSSVEFGLVSGELNSLSSDAKLKNKHVVQLTNLEHGTLYYLRAVSVDQYGNRSVTEESTFTTRDLPDTAKPHFKELPNVAGVSDDTVTLTWETDEPADANVTFTSSQGEVRAKAKGEKATKHVVTLTGLSPGEQYSYVVEAKDGAGNSSRHESINTAIAGVQTKPVSMLASWLGVATVNASGQTAGFETAELADIRPPKFRLMPEVVWSDNQRVVIAWTNDEPASAELRYGLSDDRSRVASGVDSSPEHQLVIPNLQAGLSYGYDLTLTDVAGNKTRYQGTFSSAATADTQAPVISSVVGFSSGTGVLDVEFETDEISAVTVNYGERGSDLRFSASVVGYNRLHSVRLSGLDPAIDYAFEVEAMDPAGNVARSGGDSGISDPQADSDNDGLPDDYETAYGLNPDDASDALLDSDNDGVSNVDEFLAGTDPLTPSDVEGEPGTLSNHLPVASLRVFQGGVQVAVPTLQGGVVSVEAQVRDPDIGQVHGFDWSLSDNSLIAVDGVPPDIYQFDPSVMSTGLYFVRLTVTDDGSPSRSVSYELPVRLVDGESFGEDANGNGMPDSLDLSTGSNTLLVSGVGELIGDDGVRLRLGPVAVAANRLSPVVLWSELARFGGDGGTVARYAVDALWRLDTLLSLEVHDLEAAGQAVQVVIPLKESVAAAARVRVYWPNAGWQTFRQDAFNRIYTAAGSEGNCPQPNDGSSFVPGLSEEANCLRLLMQDGGPNDIDGTQNGVVSILTGVAVNYEAYNIGRDRTAPRFTRQPVPAEAGSGRVVLSWASNETVTAELSYKPRGWQDEKVVSMRADTSHRIGLADLVPGRPYDYVLTLKDLAGNETRFRDGFSAPFSDVQGPIRVRREDSRGGF